MAPSSSPRIRRRRLLQIVGASLLALLLSSCMMSGQQQTVLDQLNWDRALNGRRTLPTHDALNAKAQSWAEKIARDGSLSHSNLRSGLPSCWSSAGENVGYGSSIAAVERAYMASSGHRANILNTSWDYAGVGYARSGSRVYTVHVFMKGCR